MPPARPPSPLVVTTSWDDGHPSDIRLADLLAKYGVRGTFYVPCRNSEGRPVLSKAELTSLAASFEIGGHTRDHVDLTTLTTQSAFDQIVSNKASLEDQLGREITGFAYVRGYYNPLVRELVKQAGYRYARCIRSLASRPGADAFGVPTTVQFFPHTPSTYVKNLISGGLNLDRTRVLKGLVRKGAFEHRCLQAAMACARIGNHFHVWGHSWELDQHGLWTALDRFLDGLRKLNARFVSNAEWAAGKSDWLVSGRRFGPFAETDAACIETDYAGEPNPP